MNEIDKNKLAAYLRKKMECAGVDELAEIAQSLGMVLNDRSMWNHADTPLFKFQIDKRIDKVLAERPRAYCQRCGHTWEGWAHTREEPNGDGGYSEISVCFECSLEIDCT